LKFSIEIIHQNILMYQDVLINEIFFI